MPTDPACCTAPDISAILRAIPGPSEGYAPPGRLCSRHEGTAECDACVHAVLTTLAPFGAIDLDGQGLCKAKSLNAQYFLLSLAEYVKSGLTIVDDWGRRGTTENGAMQAVLLSGARLVRLMETRRVGLQPEAPAIREARIVKTLIKGVNDKGRTFFLTQQDDKTEEYKLIGGHQEPGETAEQAAKREVFEELPGGSLVQDRDFSANDTGFRTDLTTVSSKFGALTNFHIAVFTVNMMDRPLELSARHLWVTKAELLNGRTSEGYRIYEDYAAELDRWLAGGLDGLPATAKLASERRSWRSWILDPEFRLWKVVGGIVGALGALATIFALLVQLFGG